MREDGKFAGKQGLCGAPGWGVTHSPPIVINPLPTTPPDGLVWCRSCVGHAAALVGQLDAFARIIAALNDLAHQEEASWPAACLSPNVTPPRTATCSSP